MVKLSKRQQEVFEMIGQGVSNREIAKKMGTSPRTTDAHRLHILNKLGLNSTTEIVKLWIWQEISKHQLLIGSDVGAVREILGVK